jgi:hypothetical protein
MQYVDGPRMLDTRLLRVTAHKDRSTYSRSSQYLHGNNPCSQTPGMPWGCFGGKDKDCLQDAQAEHKGPKSIMLPYRSTHPAISAPSQKQLRDRKVAHLNVMKRRVLVRINHATRTQWAVAKAIVAQVDVNIGLTAACTIEVRKGLHGFVMNNLLQKPLAMGKPVAHTRLRGEISMRVEDRS